MQSDKHLHNVRMYLNERNVLLFDGNISRLSDVRAPPPRLSVFRIRA